MAAAGGGLIAGSLERMGMARGGPYRYHPTTSESARSAKRLNDNRLPCKALSCGRRELLVLSGITITEATPMLVGAGRAEELVQEGADTTITERVWMDFTICPTALKPERNAMEDSAVCWDGQPLGRIVIGLYGRQVPRTVANFKAMCTKTAGSSYEGTLVHRIFPGQYFMAGRQGRRERGEVPPPSSLEMNSESVDPAAFRLKHIRPGTVSLCLSQNDDDQELKLSPAYRNVEFLVTTGPGPCPQLDYANIVFGTVLEGMDVVTAIAALPTYKPAERIRQFNSLAEFLGDERAQNARNLWNRPLRNLFITSCGELKVAKPSLPPSLP